MLRNGQVFYVEVRLLESYTKYEGTLRVWNGELVKYPSGEETARS
jgi:hypothetical protein